MDEGLDNSFLQTDDNQPLKPEIDNFHFKKPPISVFE